MNDAALVVTAAVAPLHAEPRAGSEQVSQRVAGHRLMIVDDGAAWLRVRGADGYEGWVHAGYVRRLGPGETQAGGGRVSLGCSVRCADGRRRRLPLGAVLDDTDVVEQGAALAPAERAARFPRRGDAVARTAREFFEGTPYQWGGITPWGADCSGLVQTCFGLHGIALPRDAWQQAQAGRDVGADLDTMRAADLLFFSDRPDSRFSHVAIALGPGELVHLALGRGGYATERLDRRDDPYIVGLMDRLRAIRRIDF